MIGQMTLEMPTGKLRNRVELQRISTAQARFALERFHYLHRARTGRQVNYAVLIDGVVDGVITYAYPMMSAAIEGIPSDELLEFTRLYLHSNIPHTASCAVGKSLRRIKSDWMNAFPDSKMPRLVVSWSDATCHTGTIYKAANFRWLRRTKGHPPGNTATSKRGVRQAHDDYSHDKDCWVYELAATRLEREIAQGRLFEPAETAPKAVQTTLEVEP